MCITALLCNCLHACLSLTGLFIGTLTPLLYCSIQTLSSGTAVSLSLTIAPAALLLLSLLHLSFCLICPLNLAVYLFSWRVMMNQTVCIVWIRCEVYFPSAPLTKCCLTILKISSSELKNCFQTFSSNIKPREWPMICQCTVQSYFLLERIPTLILLLLYLPFLINLKCSLCDL